MKTESAEVCGLLAANFLLLAFMMNPTAACVCAPQSPEEAYCNSNYFLKVKVLFAIDNMEKFERRYKIQITQVLKGPETLKNIRYLYTRLYSKFCGYEPPMPVNEEEYALAVRMYGGRVVIILCDFRKKWNDLSYKEKKGFEGGYKSQCN